MENPTIEFKDGKKIAKFKDGTVQEHTVEQHERAKEIFIAHRDDLNAKISAIDDDLGKMKAKTTDGK